MRQLESVIIRTMSLSHTDLVASEKKLPETLRELGTPIIMVLAFNKLGDICGHDASVLLAVMISA